MCISVFLFVVQALVLRWQPPPVGDRNGMITGYKIRYKKEGERKGSAVTEDANQRSFALSGNAQQRSLVLPTPRPGRRAHPVMPACARCRTRGGERVCAGRRPRAWMCGVDAAVLYRSEPMAFGV